MQRTGDDGMMAREIGNLRFLIERQIEIIEGLDRRGLDARAAQDLLRRLMRRDEDMRRCPAPAASLLVAGAARRRGADPV